MKRAIRHSSYANVTATLALIVALSGTAYAAATITGKNVRNGSLTGADLRSNSVRSAQVAGLRAKDFQTGQLPSRGPKGPQGPAGAAGAAGSALAYASVAADGAIDPASSAGIALRSTGEGTYCLDRTAGNVKSIQLTLRFGAVGQASQGGQIEGTTDPKIIGEAGCVAGTHVLVLTARGTTRVDLPFDVAVIA